MCRRFESVFYSEAAHVAATLACCRDKDAETTGKPTTKAWETAAASAATATAGTQAPIVTSAAEEQTAAATTGKAQASSATKAEAESALVLSKKSHLGQYRAAHPNEEPSTARTVDVYPEGRAHLVIVADDRPTVAKLTWGYAVEWKRGALFNTRFESALQPTSMWHDSLLNRRCIVPMHAFYESHGTEKTRSPRTGRLVKRQYRFAPVVGNDDASEFASRNDGAMAPTGDHAYLQTAKNPSPESNPAPADSGTAGSASQRGKAEKASADDRAAHAEKPLLLAAGIYQEDRFSVITVDPNETVAPIHNRMPLVLDSNAARMWLDPRSSLDDLVHAAQMSSATLSAAPADPKATSSAPTTSAQAPKDQLSLF